MAKGKKKRGGGAQGGAGQPRAGDGASPAGSSAGGASGGDDIVEPMARMGIQQPPQQRPGRGRGTTVGAQKPPQAVGGRFAPPEQPAPPAQQEERQQSVAEVLDAPPPVEQLSSAAAPPMTLKLVLPPPTSTVAVPRRGDVTNGLKRQLQANCFPLSIRASEVFHYDVEITHKVSGTRQGNALNPSEDKKLKALMRHNTRKLFEAAIKDPLFNGAAPVFDGNRNMYTLKSLAIPTGSIREVKFDYTDSTETIEYTMAVQPAVNQEEYTRYLPFRKKSKPKNQDPHVVDLELIQDFYEKRILQIPQECLAAIGTVLRHYPSLIATPVKHGFFIRDGFNPLPEGLELWMGYNFTVHVGQDQLYLSVDQACTPFYPNSTLIDWLAQILRSQDLRKERVDRVHMVKNRLFKTKFYVSHLQKPRHSTIMGLGKQDCFNTTFDKDGRTINLVDFFKQEYQITLKYPNLPPVNTSTQRPTYYPMELCRIKENQPYLGDITKDQQSQIIRKSAIRPQERFRNILTKIGEIKKICQPVMRDYKIEINDRLIQVPATVMKPPNILFSNKVETPFNGSWKVFPFINGGKVDNWVVISLTRIDPRALNDFIGGIVNSGARHNMAIGNPLDIINAPNDNDINIKKSLENAYKKFKGLKFILVILGPNTNKPLLKNIADNHIKVPTVCARGANVMKKCGDRQFIGNMLLKINIKVNGTNFQLEPASAPPSLKSPIMIMGINITHKGPRNKQLSYAGIVASMDGKFNFYDHEWITQESAEGVLSHLEIKVANLLKKFGAINKRLPGALVVYRDGVGEGQYPEVLSKELPILKKACLSAFPKAPAQPKITLVIGLKRHGMRFAPTNPNEGVGSCCNIAPGTVVDRRVVSPHEFEFYLCSHMGTKGTSVPTKYTVLHDDCGFTPDHMCYLTFCLAHLYTRCTRSVSVPSIMKHAQHRALRGKEYDDATDSDED